MKIAAIIFMLFDLNRLWESCSKDAIGCKWHLGGYAAGLAIASLVLWARKKRRS